MIFIFLFCLCSSDYFGLFILIFFFIFYSLYLCTPTITNLRRCLDNDIFLRFVEISRADYTGVLKCLFIYTILVLLSIFDEVTKNVQCLFYILLYEKKRCGQFPVNGTSSTWDHYRTQKMLKNVKLTFCLRFKTTSDYYLQHLVRLL